MVKPNLCLINYAPCHDDAWESGGTMPCIPNFNCTQKCKVSSALQPSCPSIYITQDLMGPSDNLDIGKTIYGWCQETNDNSSIVQLIAERKYQMTIKLIYLYTFQQHWWQTKQHNKYADDDDDSMHVSNACLFN
jgi:hypothetical protein